MVALLKSCPQPKPGTFSTLVETTKDGAESARSCGRNRGARCGTEIGPSLFKNSGQIWFNPPKQGRHMHHLGRNKPLSLVEFSKTRQKRAQTWSHLLKSNA